MKRILLMVLRNLLLVPWMWCRLCYHAAHPDKYSLEEHFKMLRFVVQRANKGGNVIVESYGTNNRCETSICPSCGGRSDAISEIFWCPECQVPIYEKNCPVCGQEGKKLTSDVRPVFP